MTQPNPSNDQVVYKPIDSAEDNYSVRWKGEEIAELQFDKGDDSVGIQESWWVIWWSPQGLSKEKAFNLKEEAKAFIATHILDIANGEEIR